MKHHYFNNLLTYTLWNLFISKPYTLRRKCPVTVALFMAQ